MYSRVHGLPEAGEEEAEAGRLPEPAWRAQQQQQQQQRASLDTQLVDALAEELLSDVAEGGADASSHLPTTGTGTGTGGGAPPQPHPAYGPPGQQLGMSPATGVRQAPVPGTAAPQQRQQQQHVGAPFLGAAAAPPQQQRHPQHPQHHQHQPLPQPLYPPGHGAVPQQQQQQHLGPGTHQQLLHSAPHNQQQQQGQGHGHWHGPGAYGYPGLQYQGHAPLQHRQGEMQAHQPGWEDSAQHGHGHHQFAVRGGAAPAPAAAVAAAVAAPAAQQAPPVYGYGSLPAAAQAPGYGPSGSGAPVPAPAPVPEPSGLPAALHAAVVQAAVDAALAQAAAVAGAAAGQGPGALHLPTLAGARAPEPAVVGGAGGGGGGSGMLAPLQRSGNTDYLAALWEYLWARVAAGEEPEESWPRRDPREARQIVFARPNLRGSGASKMPGPAGGTLWECGIRSGSGAPAAAGGGGGGGGGGGAAPPQYEGMMYLFKTKGKVDGGGNAEWPEGGALERCQLALPRKDFTEQQALAKLGVPSVEEISFRGKFEEAWVYTEKFLFVAEPKKAGEQPHRERRGSETAGGAAGAGGSGAGAGAQQQAQDSKHAGRKAGGRRAQRQPSGGGAAVARPQAAGRRRRRSEAEQEEELDQEEAKADPAAAGPSRRRGRSADGGGRQHEAPQGQPAAVELKVEQEEAGQPPAPLARPALAAASGASGAAAAAPPDGRSLPPGLPHLQPDTAVAAVPPQAGQRAPEPPQKATWRRIRAANCAAAFLEAVAMGNIQALEALLPELPRRGQPPAVDWSQVTATVVSTAPDASGGGGGGAGGAGGGTLGGRRERHTSDYPPLHLALTFLEMWPHRPEATTGKYTVPHMRVACPGCLASQPAGAPCAAPSACRLGLVRWLIRHSTPSAGSGAGRGAAGAQSPLLSMRTSHSGSVPLMTLMRYADCDGQDWSPLVGELMAHMTWADYVRADDDDDDARTRKGWYPHHIGSSRGDRWRRPPSAERPGGLPGSDVGTRRCLEACLRQLLRLATEALPQRQEQEQAELPQQQGPVPGAGGSGGAGSVGPLQAAQNYHQLRTAIHGGSAGQSAAAAAGAPPGAAAAVHVSAHATARDMVSQLLYDLSSEHYDGRLLQAVARGMGLLLPGAEEQAAAAAAAAAGAWGAAEGAAVGARASGGGNGATHEPPLAATPAPTAAGCNVQSQDSQPREPAAAAAAAAAAVAAAQHPRPHPGRAPAAGGGPAEGADTQAPQPQPQPQPRELLLPPPPAPPLASGRGEYELYCSGMCALSGRLRQLLRLQGRHGGERSPDA